MNYVAYITTSVNYLTTLRLFHFISVDSPMKILRKVVIKPMIYLRKFKT